MHGYYIIAKVELKKIKAGNNFEHNEWKLGIKAFFEKIQNRMIKI